MRPFIENYLHFMKNCLRPPYEKLKSLKSGLIKNSNFENNRVPCTFLLVFHILSNISAGVLSRGNAMSIYGHGYILFCCHNCFNHRFLPVTGTQQNINCSLQIFFVDNFCSTSPSRQVATGQGCRVVQVGRVVQVVQVVYMF